MRRIIAFFRYIFFGHNATQGYLCHIPHGVVNVFLATHVHWTMALLFGAGYITFQYWQKYDGHPVDANDLAGWLLGIVIGGLLFARGAL